MTLLAAIDAFNRLPFNGLEQAAIWARAREIEEAGIAKDAEAFRRACEERFHGRRAG
ncbi:MAG: hypothetical protein ACE5DK_05305 [Paracoccaceae bacterium]